MTRFEVFAYSNALVYADGRVRVAVVEFDTTLSDNSAQDWARQIASIFYEYYLVESIECSNPTGNLDE